MSQTIKIKGCRTCMFHYKEYGQGESIDVCSIGKEPRYECTIKELFAKCPLKKQSLIIELEQDEQQSVYGC